VVPCGYQGAEEIVTLAALGWVLSKNCKQVISSSTQTVIWVACISLFWTLNSS
jgi:hypothetical protein